MPGSRAAYPGIFGTNATKAAWQRAHNAAEACKEQEKAAKTQDKTNKREDEAAEKAHGGITALPDGYR